MSEELDSLDKAVRYDIIMGNLDVSFRLWAKQYLKFKEVGNDTLMNYCEGHLHAIKAMPFYSTKDECPCNRCESERNNKLQQRVPQITEEPKGEDHVNETISESNVSSGLL